MFNEYFYENYTNMIGKNIKDVINDTISYEDANADKYVLFIRSIRANQETVRINIIKQLFYCNNKI